VSWSLTFFLLIADFQATEVIQIVHHTGATGALQGGDLQGCFALHFHPLDLSAFSGFR